MKRLLQLLTLLLCFSCAKENSDHRSDLIDQYLHSQAEFQKFNGNVLVAEKGKIIFQHSFGVADYYTGRPLNDSTIFELASVSKQFTAMAILLLEKQGKLSVTDSLRKYLPELPYKNISIHQILTHTSGLPDYQSSMENKWDKSKIVFNEDVVKFFAQEKTPVLFEPGKKWQYSNTGYVFLATIVERVSGRTFKDFMEENIFKPLGMTHSRVYNTRRSGETIPNYANGFVWSDSLSRFALPDSLPGFDFVYFLDGIQGDGIINSTTGDLLKWDRALKDETLLGEATSTKMTAPHVLSDTVLKSYYGYGVFVGENQYGPFVNHTGGWPGYATNLARYIKDDRTIIVLSNNESATMAVQSGISAILNGVPVEIAYPHKEISLDTASLDKFTGKFSLRKRQFQIIRDSIGLAYISPWGQRIKLYPESPSKVFSKESDMQFEIGDSSNVISHSRIFYGVKDKLQKVE